VSAVLFILSDPPSRGLAVSISSLDEGRLKIAGAVALPLGSAVKIIEGDHLWLGEVIECHPEGVAVIQVSHSLDNITELTRLAGQFTGRIGNTMPDRRIAKPQPEPTLS
jgi:hypothetical protein